MHSCSSQQPITAMKRVLVKSSSDPSTTATALKIFGRTDILLALALVFVATIILIVTSIRRRRRLQELCKPIRKIKQKKPKPEIKEPKPKKKRNRSLSKSKAKKESEEPAQLQSSDSNPQKISTNLLAVPTPESTLRRRSGTAFFYDEQLKEVLKKSSDGNARDYFVAEVSCPRHMVECTPDYETSLLYSYAEAAYICYLSDGRIDPLLLPYILRAGFVQSGESATPEMVVRSRRYAERMRGLFPKETDLLDLVLTAYLASKKSTNPTAVYVCEGKSSSLFYCGQGGYPLAMLHFLRFQDDTDSVLTVKSVPQTVRNTGSCIRYFDSMEQAILYLAARNGVRFHSKNDMPSNHPLRQKVVKGFVFTFGSELSAAESGSAMFSPIESAVQSASEQAILYRLAEVAQRTSDAASVFSSAPLMSAGRSNASNDRLAAGSSGCAREKSPSRGP